LADAAAFSRPPQKERLFFLLLIRVTGQDAPGKK
jgi:hypothetical protein